MRILVTGGSGLVGHAVRAAAAPEVDAHYVGSRDADLRDAAACAALFERVGPTHVIHLAGRLGGVLENTRFIGELFRDNILINVNVLEAARRAGVESLVTLLSSCVYPDGIELPLREADLHAGEPHPSNFGYAYAKRMLEVQARAYAQQFGLRTVCLIPNNIYGPHDNFHLEASHVIPAMIRKIHTAVGGGEPAVLWGDGSPLRQLTYAHDIGRAIWWAARDYEGSPLNIGTDEEVSIRQAAETICRVLEYDPAKLIWDTNMPKGQHRKPTDTSRFRELSGLTPTPLADGVAATVAWYNENRSSVRGLGE